MRPLICVLSLLALTLSGCGNQSENGDSREGAPSASSGFEPASPRPTNTSTGNTPANTPPAKPDITVEGTYKNAEGAQAEIVGVCQMNEADIACWTYDGEPDKDLRERMLAALKAPQWASANVPTMSFKFGRKNRIIIMKITSPPVQQGKPLANINVGGVGSGELRGGVTLGIGPLTGYKSAGTGSYSRIEYRVVSETNDKSTTSIRLLQNDPIQETKELVCQAGETVNLAGQIYKISAIYPGVRDQYLQSFNTRRGAAWTVAIDRSSIDGPPVIASLSLKDTEGNALLYSDEEGKPYSTEMYVRSFEQNGRVRGAGLAMSTVHNTPRHVSVILYVDPTKVGKLVLAGTRTKIVEIVGIPLDPKR
ncbi:MAG: hypothetical protein KF784_10970 [Fimbriimonadaceae bacterium]|nr:hypothetical protein [Fimbriimonadaceae bacterium]